MKPYHCKECRKVLGYISALRFEVGGVVFSRTRLLFFECQSCGAENTLKRVVVRSENGMLAQTERISYTMSS